MMRLRYKSQLERCHVAIARVTALGSMSSIERRNSIARQAWSRKLEAMLLCLVASGHRVYESSYDSYRQALNVSLPDSNSFRFFHLELEPRLACAATLALDRLLK